MGLLLLYLFIALAISFLCSVLEAVLLSTPISFISMKEDEGVPHASRLLDYKNNIDRPIAAILSLNTIAHTVGAAGVGAQAVIVWGDGYFGLVSAVLTFLILVISEIIPKTIGSTYWRTLALPLTNVIRVLIWITYPLVLLSEGLGKLVSPKHHIPMVSREEISAMVDMGVEEGVIEQDESRAIQSFIRLGDVKVDTIMTPSTVVATAPESMTVKDFYDMVEARPFSRIPVYAQDREFITGYVLKDEVLSNLSEDHDSLTLGQLARPIVSFEEDETVSDVWDRMIEKREHVAVVVDKYGAMRGIITMEDVIETMLGVEIVDESDTATDMQSVALEKSRRQHLRALKPEAHHPQSTSLPPIA